MNRPEEAGADPVGVYSDPGQTSAVVNFSDVAPDPMSLWPVFVTVGTCTAICIALLLIAHLALARRGR